MKFFTFAAVALCLLPAILTAAPADTPIQLKTKIVALSEKLKTGDRVDKLRFLGMLELPDVEHHGLRLSQLSGLAWDDDDGILYAISDSGGLFSLQPEFQKGVLTGMKLLKSVPLREIATNKPLKGRRSDAEGLDILKGRNNRKSDTELIVSFERIPRILRYHTDGRAISEYTLPAPIDQAQNYQGANKMLESVCADPKLGFLSVPELPLKNERADYTRIFNLRSESWFYPLSSANRISALECLGKNTIVVLESQYSWSSNVLTVTLKRATLPNKPNVGTPVMAETVATLNSREGGHQIDNFEGLARHKGNRFFMISDNNNLFVQRTLLMYFELLD